MREQKRWRPLRFLRIITLLCEGTKKNSLGLGGGGDLSS